MAVAIRSPPDESLVEATGPIGGTCLHLSWICIVYTETCVYIYIDNIYVIHIHISTIIYIYIRLY